MFDAYEVVSPDEITSATDRMRLVKIEEGVANNDSIVIQHELDHLDGILFLDRIKDPKSYGDPYWLSHALGNGPTLERKLRGSRNLNNLDLDLFIFGTILFTGVVSYNIGYRACQYKMLKI